MRHIILAAAAALATAAPATAATNLVVNGSFETGDFTGWTVDTGVIGLNVFADVLSEPPTDGLYHAGFGSSTPLGILQFVPTQAGATYRFSFDLANGATDVRTNFGALFEQNQLFLSETPATFGYTSFSFDVTVSSNSTSLIFAGANPNDFWLLDNVSVTYLSGPTTPPPGGGNVVPEPATWAMLIAGFGLVGATLRRTRKTAAG
jgi:hypothetical protein